LRVKAAYAVIEKLGLGPAPSNRLQRLVAKELALRGNDIPASAGEAYLAFILEGGGKVILTHAAWKEHPFGQERGVDVVGIETGSWIPILAEAKTRRTPTGRASTLGKLKGQLRVSRTDRFFYSKTHLSGRLAITARLVELARTRDSRIPKAIDSVRISSRKYIRVGAVIAGSNSPWDPIIDACPCDVRSSRPLRLALIIVPNLKDRIAEQMAIELSP
jgi:hypothetical protein